MLDLSISRRNALQYSAAAAVALSSSGAFAAMTPKKGGILRVGKAHGSTTDTLDPGTFENGFTLSLTFALHNYLTEVQPDGSLEGELAESWEASPDATTWTFKLRDGVTFHDGKSVTAADVIASINHHRGEDSKSAAKPIVEPVTDIKADGDNVVVFELESGNADFPFLLADYHLAIGPATDGKVDWDSKIGAGGYMLETYDPGVRATFKRNPNYWKEDRAHFDGLELLSITDPAARSNALVTGEVDMIDRVELKTVKLLKRKPGINVHSTDGTQHYTFVMNTTLEPYSDRNVRLALKYGVNRQELVDKILYGYGATGNDHPVGRGQRYYNTDMIQREYDPDLAKFYLKKAGMDSLDVDLSAADAAFSGAVDAGVLYSESAKAAGINMKLTREPNDGYWSNVWMAKPFCACYWGGRPTEDWVFSTAYAAGVPWNDAYWDNAAFNVLLKEARSELDEDRRRDMYFSMQQICSDEGGTVIPMFAQYVFATSEKIATPEVMATNWDLDGERYMERWWFA